MPSSTIISNEPSLSAPHIRGSVIGPAKAWMIRTYGQPLVERALSSLSGEHQRVLRRELVSVGWYPLDAWASFATAMRREVLAATGEEGATFDRRNVWESAPQTITKIYRFVFGLLDPMTLLPKMTLLFRRVYSHGRVELVRNERGSCLFVLHSAPASMASEVARYLPLSVEMALDLAGQEVVSLTSTVENDGEVFSMQVDVLYRPKRG